MRPKKSVSTASKAMTMKFRAKMASKACVLAIHPNQWWAVPVKSRNSNTSPRKKTVASRMRIFLSIY